MPPHPESVSTVPLAVSCPSSRWCAAVGFYYVPSSSQQLNQFPLAEVWGRDGWRISRVPFDQPGAGGSASIQLSSVACTSRSNCFAVGVSGTSPLVERWDGSGWHWESVPVPSQAFASELVSVSCANAHACVAVGVSLFFGPPPDGASSALIERWNGSSWSRETVAAASGATELRGVTCLPDPKACTAVGDGAPGVSLLAFRSSRGGWSPQSMPTPPGGGSPSYVPNAVSCSTIATCMAVGSGTGPGGASAYLADQWRHGAWSVSSLPLPGPGATFDGLSGVTCPGQHTCVAVGEANTTANPDTHSWIVRSHGSEWTLDSTEEPPTPPGSGAILSAVSCSSLTVCTSVGYYQDGTPGGGELPYAERFTDGR